MVFWKYFTKTMKNRHVTARINQEDFRSLPFKNDWNTMVKKFDLRMWFVQSSPNDKKALKYTHELEKIHNELNYLNFRGKSLACHQLIHALNRYA